VSGINYNNRSGEIMHLNFKEADFKYTELLQALKEQDVRDVICRVLIWRRMPASPGDLSKV
jgi:hypothetical protein